MVYPLFVARFLLNLKNANAEFFGSPVSSVTGRVVVNSIRIGLFADLHSLELVAI